MDSPQIRVKLSSAEVEGSPRVDLDFGVKEENVFRFQQEGIWTTSPGKVASPRSEGCESPMKQALHAAEAFERGQTPPLSPEDKRAREVAARQDSFTARMKAFTISDEAEDAQVETLVSSTRKQYEKPEPKSRGKVSASILERMKMFE